MGKEVVAFGATSLTLRCKVRNKPARKSILNIEKMVFVNMGDGGKPAPHGKTEVTYIAGLFNE